VAWQPTGAWHFTIDGDVRNRFERTFDDRCGSAAAPTKPVPVATGPDYDVKHFDPSAYVSKATAEIQKLAPGAKLTSIEFEHVGSDGRVDLTKVTQFHTFGFRVARPLDDACDYWVSTEASGVTTGKRDAWANDTACPPPPPAPKCTFAQIWKRALAKGASADRDATMFWTGAAWSVSQSGDPHFEDLLDDACR